MLDIKITRTTCPKEKPQDETKLGFGKKFTDHMFVMDYTEGEGWHDARIVPYAPFPLDPATVVFHYAQEIFEGMKAYRTADDTIQLFRPDCNAKRMQDSADRLCIPKIPVEDYIQAVEALVDVDRDWVPHADGASLYIRPFVFANDVGLGVHASKHYIFCIICAPSGAYYAEGINPVRIYVEDEYIRAAPGLTGFTKCGGNYAASIKAGELAEEQGYAQVLWLDGVEKKYVEEVGIGDLPHPVAIGRLVPADGLVHQQILLFHQKRALHKRRLALQAADGDHCVVAERPQRRQIHIGEATVAIGVGVDAADAAQALGVAAQAVVAQLHVPICTDGNIHHFAVARNIHRDFPVQHARKARQHLHQLAREERVLIHLIIV